MFVLSLFIYVQHFAILQAVTCKAPMSMGFSRQEYLNGLPFSSPAYLPNPGIKPTSLKSPALAGGFFTTSTPWESPRLEYYTVLDKYLYIWSPIQMLQIMKNRRHISTYTMNEERSEKLFSRKIDEKQVKDAQDKKELRTTPQKSNDLTHSSPRNEAELVRMQQRGTPTGNWGDINVP